QSAAIRLQITTAVRSNVQKPYDTNSAIFTMSKKFVTITWYAAPGYSMRNALAISQQEYPARPVL
ncbi:MAG: hypothetical protein ACLQSR_01150, partial [Limisphaerales bacterium]